jgi:hypothetical protein
VSRGLDRLQRPRWLRRRFVREAVHARPAGGRAGAALGDLAVLFKGGKWSKWTGVSVGPGESQLMDWNTDAGDCVVPFRIIYKDIETEQYKVDWCKISNIRVHDDKVTAD